MEIEALKKLNLKYKFDHVGIAVSSIEESKKFYMNLGMLNYSEEIVQSEKVKVFMIELENDSRIELIEGLDETSPISKFIEKKGEGIHHICLRVNDIGKAIELLRAGNIRLIYDEPKKGAHNCLITFIHPKSTGGVLIELSEKIMDNTH